MNPHHTSTSRRCSRSVCQLALLVVLLVLCAVGFVSSTAQAPQAGREVEDKIPKHLPIKVKVKNLNSEKWTRELEIEVTNTGEKPIYLLHLALVTPEIKSETGHDIGMVVIHYGRWALVDFSEPLQPDDVPIQPGEIHTFKISARESLGWENFSKRRNLPKDEPKKVRLVFGELNFGDGTGFSSTGGVPIDIHRKVSLNCAPSKGNVVLFAANQPPRLPPDSLGQLRSSFLPASFLPVKFYSEKVDAFGLNGSSLRQDTCCPGQPDCAKRKDSRYTCCLGDAHTTESASCTDPAGICGTDYEIDREEICDEFGTRCPEFFTDPCPPANSTPTPTPTETPTPTATPTQTPTPPPVCDPATRPNDSRIRKSDAKRASVLLRENGLT